MYVYVTLWNLEKPPKMIFILIGQKCMSDENMLVM